MRPSRPLKLEQLEDRLTPSASGFAWPDPSHLTLSFAPDGTDIAGTGSGLFNLLGSQGSPSSWEKEILRGLQTWTVNANLNISEVSDGGQPFGATGALEGDSRFGDVRVGAKPLPLGTIATGTHFDWSGSTWAGDIVLNSNYTFGMHGRGQYDLFSVILHEAGHVFGLDDNADPSSVMYANYQGPRSGPNAQDVLDLQSMYSARTQDPPNGTIGTASWLPLSLAPSANGDIATTHDVDFYKFIAPLGPFVSFAVNVQTARISSLIPSLSIYDMFGRPIASGASKDPTTGDLVVQVNSLLAGLIFYARVGANSGDVFGVGSYHLGVQFLTSSAPYTPPLIAPVVFAVDGLLHDTLATAAKLTSPWGNSSDARFQALYAGNLSDSGEANYFQVQAPQTMNKALVVLVWGMDATNPLQARINVFDSSQQPLPIQVLANGGGLYTVQIVNPLAGSVYYLKVSAYNSAGANDHGNYILGARFHDGSADVVNTMGSNTLTKANANDSATLAVGQSQLMSFALSAFNGNASAPGGLTMTITDSQGNVILTLMAVNGMPPVTAVLYLLAGNYTVHYQADTAGQSLAMPLTYWLDSSVLSDPLGAYSTTKNPPPSSPPNYTGSNTSTSNTTSRPYYY